LEVRLFTGLDLPEAIKGDLGRLVDRLRPQARVRWSKVENLHITTKFIGEWPEDRLGELRDRLARVSALGPITIEIKGLGWFPNPHQPQVFWAAVRAPEALEQLATATGTACSELGIAHERRRFTPHLTLARMEPRGGGSAPDLAPLRRAIAALPSTDFGTFEAVDFHLYLSEPEAGGSRYTKLATFPIRPLPIDS
jgi:2'-5' RNA ligase